MIDLIVVLVCGFIIGLFNSQMDTIKFKPNRAWSQSDWWLEYSILPVSKRNFGEKYISFYIGGWHLCKFIMRLAESFIIAYLFTSGIISVITVTIFVYLYIGSMFEVFYPES